MTINVIGSTSDKDAPDTRDPLDGLPELPLTALPNRPYLYLDQYTAKQAAIFFGRGREIAYCMS